MVHLVFRFGVVYMRSPSDGRQAVSERNMEFVTARVEVHGRRLLATGGHLYC